ncbi:MAG: two-component system, LytTR family, sensor kinase [Blastocatellia bacterium]|nr:two-component system, LytTR family, sensor kinase [Blastocatellia bacterium]
MKNAVHISYGVETGNPLDIKTSRLKWAILFGFWTFFSFLYANQIYFEMLHNPRMHHSWWRIAFWQLLAWYSWGCLSPLILKLGRRFPCEGPAWLRGLPVHLSAAVTLSAFHIAVATALRMLVRPFDVWSDVNPFLVQYQGELRNFFLFDFFVYWAILGVGYAFDYRERYREREAQAAQLKAQLAQAQLESLKMQLHPHFLFNTLHTISGLVRTNERQPAVNMIAGLSDLLRHALESADEQEVPLRDEVKLIELYLDIQRVRFSDRLTVRLEIAPETLDALVPNLLLQPLVENAIRHGISFKDTAGVIIINAYRDEGMLRIRVCDDGPGLQSGWRMEENEGIGLANTSERLKYLYGAEHRFDLSNGSNGGMIAAIAIPFRVGYQTATGR